MEWNKLASKSRNTTSKFSSSIASMVGQTINQRTALEPIFKGFRLEEIALSQ